MTKFKLLGVAAILSTVTAVTSASAQLPIWAAQNPGAFQAQYPDRDVLNGGAPNGSAPIFASRMGLELRGGSVSRSYARASTKHLTRALAKHH
jgi:hypothetical protein